MCLYAAATVGLFFYRGFSMNDFSIAVTQNFGGFHYLFEFFALASISSAFVIDQITQKNAGGSPKLHGFFALLLVCLLNLNGFFIVMDMHRNRMQSNAEALPIYGSLSRLEPQETIPSPTGIAGILGMNISIHSYNLGEPSKLECALDRMRSQ